MCQDGSLRLRHRDFRSYLWKLPRAFVDAIFLLSLYHRIPACPVNHTTLPTNRQAFSLLEIASQQSV